MVIRRLDMSLLALVIYILTLLWIAVSCAGVALLALGVRGRVADRHLRCRRCGHVYITGGSDPSKCTECGCDLREPGSLRIGRRRVNETQIVFSMMLLAASAATVLGVVRHNRVPSAVVAAAVGPAGSATAAAPPPLRLTAAQVCPSNDIYYPPVKDRPLIHRVATIEGDGAVVTPGILQQMASAPQYPIPSTEFAGSASFAPVATKSTNGELRQRVTASAATAEAASDPLADWTAAHVDWLSFELDSVGGRTRDMSTPAFDDDPSTRATATDILWKAPASNIAEGRAAEASGSARLLRVKPQSTAIKPARAGAGASAMAGSRGRNGR
jgi:hypothetical protein